MTETTLTRPTLVKTVVIRLIEAILALMAMFFIPAGTLAYWEAWLYLAILFIPMIFVMFYLLRNDPELLERRMRFGEKEKTQKRVINLSLLWFLLAFIIPGLDFRFGWSSVPLIVVLVAALFVLLGYIMVFFVFRENTYASRVIEVAKGQKVIDTGPYAIVRHPMYIGAIVMYLFSPLALGSWWAVLFALPIIPLLVVRILNEEKILSQDLPGYGAYCQKVRYRLLPGIW